MTNITRHRHAMSQEYNEHPQLALCNPEIAICITINQ